MNMSIVVSVNFTNNVFNHIEDRGLTFKNWNIVVIKNNTFRKLDVEAINTDQPYHDQQLSNNQFYFVGNVLADLEVCSLILSPDQQLIFSVADNVFVKACQCDLYQWLKLVISGASEKLLNSFYNGSYCAVDSVLARCFQHPEGFLLITNFTESVCQPEDTIICEQPTEKVQVNAYNNPNILKAVEILNEGRMDYDRTVINSIFTVALTGVCVTLMLSAFLWLNRNGYFRKVFSILFPPPNIFLSIFSRIVAGATSNDLVRTTSAHSITRISVLEYVELHQQRKMPPAFDDSSAEHTITCEDKATQTLPEELTHELLQSLREKLNDPDPDNYSEARTMIEHLYDLIKVEESCNNNTSDEFASELNDALYMDDPEDDEVTGNVYEVIRCPRQKVLKRNDRSCKTLVNAGTRAPSPDKLMPMPVTTAGTETCTPRVTVTVLSEYTEPMDRVSYLYAELTNDTATASSSPLLRADRAISPSSHFHSHMLPPSTIDRASSGTVPAIVQDKDNTSSNSLLGQYSLPDTFQLPVYSDMLNKVMLNRPFLATTESGVSSHDLDQPSGHDP